MLAQTVPSTVPDDGITTVVTHLAETGMSDSIGVLAFIGVALIVLGIAALDARRHRAGR